MKKSILSTLAIAATISVHAQTCDPPPTGLVGWWRAEGDTYDFLGLNSGVLHGGVGYVTGQVGQAFSLDGASGYVEVPGSASLKFTNAMTAEAWIKLNSTSGTKTVITKGQDSDNSDDWLMTIVGGQLNGSIYAGGSWQGGNFSTTMNSGVWYHVAITYDGSVLCGYVNGVLDGQRSISGSLRTTDYALRIGAYAPTNGVSNKNFFAGLIDEASVYNRALSSNEIAAIYAAGLSGKCAQPLPPKILYQPLSQVATIGHDVTLTVLASGTPVISYQWTWNGTNMNNATNATLLLTNVQFSQAGNYAVQISNIAGSTNSSNAVLTVSLPPLPPSGLVGWWQAESNAWDFLGLNSGTTIGGVTYGAGVTGQAFNLNGTSGYVEVPSSSSLKFTNAMTAEAWIKLNSTSGTKTVITKGQDSDAPGDWLMSIVGAQLNGSLYAGGSWQGGNFSTIMSPGTWYHVAITYDGSWLCGYVNGVLDGQKNVLGSLRTTDYALRIGAYAPVNGSAYKNFFAGLIDEASVYNRALTSNEIATLYSAGKRAVPAAPSILSQPTNQTVLAGSSPTLVVFTMGTPLLYYQWSLNGTNLPGATNATLNLTNIQPFNAGNYQLAVTNSFGSTNSAIATLIVVEPPRIVAQPVSQTVLSYHDASFSVSAAGTLPLSYHWRKNGLYLSNGGNVSGSTSTNLVLTSVGLGDAGNYSVVVSNAYATTNSIIAVLTVPQTAVTLNPTNAMAGTTIVVPVTMNALGVENTFLASVGYDPTKLVLQRVHLGQTLTNAYLQEVDSQTNNGEVGFAIFLDWAATLPAGTQKVAELVFQTMPAASNATVSLTFGDNPTLRQLLDDDWNMLPAIYQGGTITLTPTEYAADVYPRTNGDNQVTLLDWAEVGRMVAGLDFPVNSDELARADCAPRYAPDGVLTVTDWVQAGRYALALDSLTLVNSPAGSGAPPPDDPGTNRVLQVATVSAQRGQPVSVPVQLVCQTNENAVGLTLGYNTNQLKWISVALGSAMTGGRLNINSNQLRGELGVVMALPPGAALPAGTNEVARLQFETQPNASDPAALILNQSVVKLQVADKMANVLAAVYVNGAVVLPAQPMLKFQLTGSILQLSWPLVTGTFQVQAANSPLGPWSALLLPITTNGLDATVTVSATNQQQYFRLQGQ
ncbi:MAG TPA: LamG-like jellyroll fold domain-containing protein [Candidatus Acidoferrum sp.]|nr:LamG-like jellyroll fold domain-containing protein [Candidatus Acidoferrum sp.]